ncbi:MAG: tetratricopeptide repeat protein [Planctomycetes bacterium]|nr:tetratricopeptide repeat protein [Planctomycetota bacterium]
MTADSVDALVREALERARQGDLAGAIAILDRAVEAEPRSAVALCNRAVLLYTQRRLQESRNDFVRALAVSPGLPRAVEGLRRIERKERQTGRVGIPLLDPDAPPEPASPATASPRATDPTDARTTAPPPTLQPTFEVDLQGQENPRTSHALAVDAAPPPAPLAPPTEDSTGSAWSPDPMAGPLYPPACVSPASPPALTIDSAFFGASDHAAALLSPAIGGGPASAPPAPDTKPNARTEEYLLSEDERPVLIPSIPEDDAIGGLPELPSLSEPPPTLATPQMGAWTPTAAPALSESSPPQPSPSPSPVPFPVLAEQATDPVDAPPSPAGGPTSDATTARVEELPAPSLSSEAQSERDLPLVEPLPAAREAVHPEAPPSPAPACEPPPPPQSPPPPPPPQSPPTPSPPRNSAPPTSDATPPWLAPPPLPPQPSTVAQAATGLDLVAQPPPPQVDTTTRDSTAGTSKGTSRVRAPGAPAEASASGDRATRSPSPDTRRASASASAPSFSPPPSRPASAGPQVAPLATPSPAKGHASMATATPTPTPVAARPHPRVQASTEAATPRGIWRTGERLVGEVSEYEVRRVLARTERGILYEAQDRRLEAAVALKVPFVHGKLGVHARDRFAAAAGGWIELGPHPNLVAAHNADCLRGCLCVVTEVVPGAAVLEAVRERRFTGVAGAIDLGLQCCEALLHAHLHGVLHGNLTPGNVLVDEDGALKVTDFAVGRVPWEETAPAGSDPKGRPGPPAGKPPLRGLPPYLAPELFEPAAEPTIASDVYAFGCVLFAVACGRPPFADEKKYGSDPVTSLRLQHERDEPPDPRRLNPAIPDRLASLLLGCLRKLRTRRPDNFEEVRRALLEAYAEAAGRPYARPRPQPGALGANDLARRGMAYRFVGQLQRALEALDRALQLNPAAIRAYRNRSIVRRELNDLRGAREDAEKAIALNARYAEAYVQRGILRQAESAGRLSLADFEKAIELNMHILEAWLARATYHMGRRQFHLAIEDLDSAVSHWPGEPTPLWLRAVSREQFGQIAGAVDDYLRALQADEGYVDRWYEQEGPASSRKCVLGKKQLAEALRRRPADPRFLFYRGRYRESKGQALLALQDYRRALELEPNLEKAYAERWRGYQEDRERRLAAEIARLCEQEPVPPAPASAGNGPTTGGAGTGPGATTPAPLEPPPDDAGAGAWAEYEAAEMLVERKSSDPGSYLLRGQARLGLEDVPGALADFTRAVELDPNCGEAYRLRAPLRALQGDLAGARRDLDEAVQLNPRNASAYYDRAILLRDRAEGAAALHDLDTALKLEPGNVVFLRLRGQVRGMEGDPKGARADLEEADRLEGKGVQEG